ncbi:hypothetical protein GpartN1_g6407.t1 [Galdieria partita]|uniref:Cell morphogenesis protein N-terminal domain-containing protein n=1 Tax=Galdieria partita TaxID=83374 RepID=A0A9C7Q1R5_9RHOD|nr:hypothetical protein GpartN1_g6407.t1 [Galdieria partita]
MVVKNGTNNDKTGSFSSKSSLLSQPIIEDREASNVVERGSHLCQEAVKHLQKIVSEVAKKGEKHSGASLYGQSVEQEPRLLRCIECLLTVSRHCRCYAVSLIIEWMKESQSKSRNSKYLHEELATTDSDGILIYIYQLRTLQRLLDKMLLEKCEIPKNLVDDMLSLTVEELLKLAKNSDNECSPCNTAVLTACNAFLGSLSMFSLHDILSRFHGKMLNSVGSTSLSSLFSLRDSENENLFYLSILKGLRISLFDVSFTKNAVELLEFYRLLLAGTRSTAIKHMIADNISILLQNMHIELFESTWMAKWYKTVDELYGLFQKWLTKPKHMAKGFPVCSLLLKVKHVDVLKRELWPFVMRCCKQYEDSKELQLKIAIARALNHALKLYITMKDPSSIPTDQLLQILKKILSAERLFSQASKNLYDILTKCVITVIRVSPVTWINILEEWWQNNKFISLSEISYVFVQVILFSLKGELLLKDEALYNDGSPDESEVTIDWSPDSKSKLAHMSFMALKTTCSFLDRTRSQAMVMMDPLDIHCLLKLQLKGVHCLLDSIGAKEIQALYAPVTDMACQTDYIFMHEAEALLLDTCNQAEDAEESVLFQILLKFNFRKSNPLDLSYSHVGRIIQVFNQVLLLRKRSSSGESVNKPIGSNLRTVLLRIQEVFVLLYFLPSVDLRRSLRESLMLMQTLMFDRTCSELEEFSVEDKLDEMYTEELKARSNSRGTNDELSYELSSTSRFSRFLRAWRSFLAFTVQQSPENSRAGVLNAEQMLLYLKGQFEQSIQGNLKLHDRFPGFHIFNISFLESIELNFSLLFYSLCSIHEQCKLASLGGLTEESRSQLRKMFQLVLSPSLLGIDGTKSSLCTIYLSRLLEVLKNIPSQLSLCIAMEAEDFTFSSPHLHQTKGRSKRQKDHYRIFYAKILLALLDTLNETDKNYMDNGILELYSRFFSKMLQIMGQAVESPQNPFDLMALRETFCLCLLKALSIFIPISSFSVHFKGIWKDTLLLMQRWIASSNARKYSSALRGSSIFRTSFHDRSSREEALTVEDLQERIRKLSLICVTVLLGYAESFSISREVFDTVSFHLDSLFSSLLEDLKEFDSYTLSRLQCDSSMLKPAIIKLLRFDRHSLRTLMELSILSANHSNESVAYYAARLLLEYIHFHYDREDMPLKNDQLCVELFSLVYFLLGWDREHLYPLALESLVSLVSVATKNFTYESSLELHEYFPSLCQDENLINDISKRGAILCAEVASSIVSAVFSKIEQSIKDNIEYNYPRILSFLESWLERGDISESVIEGLLSLEETAHEKFHNRLTFKAFDILWHALGYRKDNLQRAISVLVTATNQKLKQSNKRSNGKLELIKRAAVKLSENRVGVFLLNMLSYILPYHVICETTDSCKDMVSEREPNRQLEDTATVVVLLSEIIQRNSEDIRSFLPFIFHLAIFTELSNNVSYQRHGRLLLANVLSRFLLPYIERCCRQDVWRHCVQLASQIAADMQQLAVLWSPKDIACSPEEMQSPRDGDLQLSSFLEKLIELSSYCEPQLRTLWSRHCLALIRCRLGHILGVVSLRLYRLLGPCLDKSSVETLISYAKNEFFTHNPDRSIISHLLQIFYILATKVKKENLVAVPPMLSLAFELTCSKEPWIRLHAAYLFTMLYSSSNSVGEGIFHQLVETEFCSGLDQFPPMLEICKLSISTTQLQKSEHVIFIYLSLLLRIPWRQEASKQKTCLVPVILTSFIFLTALLVSQNDDQKAEEKVLQLYSQTISEADLSLVAVEYQSYPIAYFRITCVHLCYILKRLRLSSLAQTLQNFCNSRKYWKLEDFLYQLRSPLLSFWLDNVQNCQNLVVAWLETNNSLSYRRGALRLMEAILVQAGQQSILQRLVSCSSDILNALVSLVDGALHEEVVHLLELLD